MRVNRVGVVGAGVIGTSTAQDLAQTGHEVLLIDVSDGILERARKQIAANARFHHLLAKTPERQNVSEVLGRIHLSTDYDVLAGADLVIENTTENWEIKRAVYQRIDKICREEVVFAANTSAIPITRIASATRRAPQLVGLHFMNPVPLKPAVEVVRGFHTSDKTIELAIAFLAQMNKEAIVVRDSPGFVANRVLMLSINEAVFLLHENIASVEDVDKIFKRCFGHRMGPLETADLIGLDTVLRSIEVLSDAFNDSKYRPCPLLTSMVDAGLLGRKSGRGFYTYGEGSITQAGTGEKEDTDGN
jgi:3-hydroxybutyryl-CoA dehydrogenase